MKFRKNNHMRHELLICKSEFGIEVKCKLEITINIKLLLPDLQDRVNICFILCVPGDRYLVYMNRCECSNCMDAVSLDKRQMNRWHHWVNQSMSKQLQSSALHVYLWYDII